MSRVWPPQRRKGTLEVRVCEARGVPNTQWVSKPDPYAVVRLVPGAGAGSHGAQSHRTKTVENNVAPVWDEAFSVTVDDVDSRGCVLESTLAVEVWNHNVLADERLGHYRVALNGLTMGEIDDRWFTLQECPVASTAEIRLRIMAVDFGLPPTPEQLAARQRHAVPGRGDHTTDALGYRGSLSHRRGRRGSPPPSEYPCKYINTPSGCRDGDKCRYKHEEPHQPTSHHACKYYAKPGGCKDGNSCKYRHDAAPSPSNAPGYKAMAASHDASLSSYGGSAPYPAQSPPPPPPPQVPAGLPVPLGTPPSAGGAPPPVASPGAGEPAAPVPEFAPPPPLGGNAGANSAGLMSAAPDTAATTGPKEPVPPPPADDDAAAPPQSGDPSPGDAALPAYDALAVSPADAAPPPRRLWTQASGTAADTSSPGMPSRVVAILEQQRPPGATVNVPSWPPHRPTFGPQTLGEKPGSPLGPRDISGVTIGEAQLRHDFAKYDTNRNGVLDAAEFRAAYKGMEWYGNPPSDREMGKAFADAHAKAAGQSSPRRQQRNGNGNGASTAADVGITYPVFCQLMLTRAAKV